MKHPIAVIGLGHVGLTLALTLAEQGFKVVGVEKSPEATKHLQNIQPPFFETGLKELLKKHLKENFEIFDHLPNRPIGIYILCVGTPLKKDSKMPDLEMAQKAISEISRHLQDEALVILRSTVPVGTSRNFFLPILQASRKKFYYACCPERTCEGVALKELLELPQIIGGMNEPSQALAMALFKKVTPHLVKASSLEEAEIVKLMDNCWRDTTFAFANEMALLCESLDLDACAIIDLANLGYHRNTIPQPGFVGGPCLTKDPLLLTKPAGQKERTLPLTQTARLINQQLTQHVCERIRKFFEQQGKEIEKCKIVLSGLSFKGDPPTDDLRSSPAIDLLRCLRQMGIKTIYGHDFVVSASEISKLDIPPISIEEGFQKADAVLILNNHKHYQQLDIMPLLSQMNKPAFFFDAWHLFSKQSVKNVEGITHGGIGF